MVVLIGYLASGILAVSLMMSNALRFRWLNISGNICFIVYGVFIQAFPIIVANSILFSINIYQLVRLLTFKETFHHVPFTTGDAFVEKFLSFYKNDLEAYFPGFRFQTNDGRVCFVVLRDLVIANIFVARLAENGRATVEVNYTVPNYRDFKVGRFIFDKEKEYLLSQGVRQIVYDQVAHKNHEHFIKVMGFEQQGAGYVKLLDDSGGMRDAAATTRVG
ncbi:MAG: hypothetical protein ABIX01_21570 [Chitinophagaceae bacterium]